VLWQKPAFYGHPTLSSWFISEYKKSGKKLGMGKGCVRFKSLEDLALGVRFAGREPYGGRPRAVASWSREAGAAVLVKTGRPHRCARVRGGAYGQLPGGEGAHGQGKLRIPKFFASKESSRAGQQRKERRQEVRGEESRRHAVNHKAGTLLMH
jgi:hypothetical protein